MSRLNVSIVSCIFTVLYPVLFIDCIKSHSHFCNSYACSGDSVPKEVSWKREKKWLDMLDNWDYWMRKQFYKVHLGRLTDECDFIIAFLPLLLAIFSV